MQTELDGESKSSSFRDKVTGFWSYYPRWQTSVSDMFTAGLAKTTGLSPDALDRFQYGTARLLGQPMSLGAWPKMTFNDKVTYRRLRSRDERLIDFADKLRMRDYAIARLGEACVPKVLRVGDRAEAFADLVGPFVLKGNHGSGWVILVEEERRLTDEELGRVQSWIDTDYGTKMREWAYRFARRLAYAEELLNPVPPDYKFFAFNGKPEALSVVLDRFTDHHGLVCLRPDWTPLGAISYIRLPSEVPPQPPNLDQMLSWASVLSEGLDFLRVDLYDLGDRVLVGELTPYPNRGAKSFSPRELDSWLGRRWTARPDR